MKESACDDSPAAKKPCVATAGSDDGNPGTSAAELAAPAPLASNASAPQQGQNMSAQPVTNPQAQVNQPLSMPASPSPKPAMAPPMASPPTLPVRTTRAVPVSAVEQPPPPRPLRHPCLAAAGPASLPRRRWAVVTLLLPEAGVDANRADILVPRRSYARLLFSWPSADVAVAFRCLFPLSLRLASARTVLLKAYDDPHPEFTASKANGTTTLSVRNVPISYDPDDIKEFLLDATTEDGLPWLENLHHFHRVSDPFEVTIMDGIPIPCPDDPNFKRILASIPLEEGGLPMLLNFSSHPCTFCASNLQDADRQILGAHAVPVSFCNDPGLLFIGLDSLVEPYTCVLCDFCCGKALDSAMSHMASGPHAAQLRTTSHLPPAKEKYSTWRALTLLEQPCIAAFLHA
ncbi:unnamed protein product [Closterium sp. NIES-64]|nr:unnamed protein product [Closterium sp. NIES-64]